MKQEKTPRWPSGRPGHTTADFSQKTTGWCSESLAGSRVRFPSSRLRQVYLDPT